MKKIILLSATALLLAGCASPAAVSSTVGTATPSASSSVAPVASGVSTDYASSPAAKASASVAATAPTDTVSAAPALSTAETCKAFLTVLGKNKPAAGSSDNQKYWATVRDQLRPVVAEASAESKPTLDGIFTYFDTRANHWSLSTAQSLGEASAHYFTDLDKLCPTTKK